MQIVSSSSSPRSARVEHCEPTGGAARKRCADTASSDRDDATPRSNPLVAAMTQALQSLVPGSAAQPADATPTGDGSSAKTTTATTASTAGDLKDAAVAFAHELFQALRTDASGRAAGEGPRSHGHGHHHRHDRYDNLAQRLDRLASQLTNPPATETATSGSTTPSTASDATASTAASSPSTDPSAATSTSAATPTTPAAAAPAESPLLGAFRKLYEALQPSAGTGAGTASPDVRAALATFLHTMAQALSSHGEHSQPASAAVSSGSLVNVTA